MRHHFIYVRGDVISKKQKITNTGKDVEKLELVHFAVRNLKWYGFYEEHSVVSQKN